MDPLEQLKRNNEEYTSFVRALLAEDGLDSYIVQMISYTTASPITPFPSNEHCTSVALHNKCFIFFYAESMTVIIRHIAQDFIFCLSKPGSVEEIHKKIREVLNLI